jgi:membrane-associated phospholipid phosphatase
MMDRKTDRRTALKVLTAAPLGLAASAALAGDAYAQGRGTEIRPQALAGPVEPNAGSWKTWLLSSGSELRIAPPPDDAASRAEIEELRSLAAGRDAAADRIVYWDAGAAPYRWNEIAIELSHVKNNFGGSTVGRSLALLNVAIHDAIVTAWDSKYAYNRKRPSEIDSSFSTALPNSMSPSYPCEHAVAAGAASAVLGYLFPSEAASLETMAQEAAQSRVIAGVQYPSDARAGLELGRAVAARVVEYGRSDNSDAKWSGTIPTGPGIWNGTNPGGVAELLWKPWVLSSADQFRLPPPPAPDSEQRAIEVAEVKNFARTPVSTGLAYHWQFNLYGGPNIHVLWNRYVSQKIFEERLDYNAPWAARAYSMESVGYMDAYIASQDGKFSYWVARPNMFDPSITTLFPNPNHPSYPSNAAIFNGTVAAILAHLFPRDAALFKGLGDQAGESRIWAGIHFRSDVEGGRTVAKNVADAVIARIT